MNLDKNEIKIEKVKHRQFLKQNDFDLKLPHSMFLDDYLKIIKKRYSLSKEY